MPNSITANIDHKSTDTVDRDARDRLITARIGLLLKHPFFGNLATRLRLVNADSWCKTAATDGRHFYYNSQFIMSLNDEAECEFLFGHEVLHVIYEHVGRRVDGDHEAQLSNIAADYCVNNDLVKHKIGRLITSTPCLYDRKYDGWSYEKVYNHLYATIPKISISEYQILDEHLENEESQGSANSNNTGSGSAEGANDKGKKSGAVRPVLSEEQKHEIRDEFREAIIGAVRDCSNPGDLPAGVRHILKEINDPKMPWHDLLRMHWQSVIKSDYTFSKMSRKAWHLDAILPGRVTSKVIDIVIACDASGSIIDQAMTFLAEIKAITQDFSNFKIHIFSFDTEIYNPQTYNSGNLDDIGAYQIHGGGGTEFNAIFKYLKDEQIMPQKLVVFTDGYPCHGWGDPNYCDTLWIIYGNNNSPSPPFGEWAVMD